MLYEEVIKEADTFNTKMDLANAYMIAAEQYTILGESELKYILQAEKCYQKCLNLCYNDF